MATFFEGAYLGYWNSVENHFYGSLYGDVVRNGNTVTLTNMSLSAWTRYSSWGTMNFSLTINGTTTWFTASPSGSYAMNATSFSVSPEQTSANVGWYTSDGASGSFAVYFPAGVTPPTGLNVTGITSTTDSFTANVSITGWGIGSGTRYRELQVWTNSSSGLVEPKKYQPQVDNELSGNITANNSSAGQLVIQPNTTYVIGAYATNGSANTGSIRFAQATTKPLAPASCVLTATGSDTATLSITSPSQGSGVTMTAYYKINNGQYVSAGTITSGGTITKQLTGLTPNTAYTVTAYISNISGNSDTKISEQIFTYPATPSVTISDIDSFYATITIISPSQGTAKAMVAKYKINDGDWETMGTITSGGSVGDIVHHLTPNSQNTLYAKIVSDAGESQVYSYNFDTTSSFYGQETGFGRNIIKLYGSVDGKTKEIDSFYGSADGVSEKIF